MRTRMRNGNGGRGGRVQIIELLKDSQEVTAGAASYKYRNVGPDMIVDVGGKLESITVFSTISNISANFAVQVQAQYSNDGRIWTAFAANVEGPLNANGNAISTEYKTLTDFGRYLRFQVGITDAGATETATLTLSVALRYYQGA